MSKAREKRLVLRQPWRVDEPEFNGALEEVNRRVSLIHEREAIRNPPGEDLVPFCRRA
jgi:hypothetical protein